MKKYILSLMDVCGNKIRKMRRFFHTQSRSSTREQGKSNSSAVVQELPLLKEKSRVHAHNKYTTRGFPKCPVNGKISYREQKAKEVAIKKTNKLTKIRAYKCEFCPHWHITHKKNKLTKH
jgi:hypothetical protein